MSAPGVAITPLRARGMEILHPLRCDRGMTRPRAVLTARGRVSRASSSASAGGESSSLRGKISTQRGRSRARASGEADARSVSVAAVAGVDELQTDAASAGRAKAAATNGAPKKAKKAVPQKIPQPREEFVEMKDIHAVVLAGGPDSGNPMTRTDSKAAQRFAATYRLIDIPLANLIASGVSRTFVLTQWNAHSLNQHVQAAYPQDLFGFGDKGFVECLPSYQRPEEKTWSTGSADSVRRHYQAGTLQGKSHGGCLSEPKAYIICSGESLYQMDYNDILKTHNETGAEITIATQKRKVGDIDYHNLGVLSMREDMATAVEHFKEKPSVDELKEIAVCGDESEKLEDCEVAVNMGIYVFSERIMRDLLGRIECVADDMSLDLGKDFIPMAIGSGYAVHAHEYAGYWQPIRTFRDWYDANMELCRSGLTPEEKANTAASLVSHEFKIFTIARCLPPAKFNGDVYTEGTIASEGVCVGANTKLTNALIGPCVAIGPDCDIADTIFVGNLSMNSIHNANVPDVGKGSVLRGVVVDRDVVIGEGCVINNARGWKSHEATDADGHGYVIQDGIVTLLQGTVLPPGTVI